MRAGSKDWYIRLYRLWGEFRIGDQPSKAEDKTRMNDWASRLCAGVIGTGAAIQTPRTCPHMLTMRLIEGLTKESRILRGHSIRNPKE